MPPMVCCHQWPMWEIWNHFVQQVIRIPVPISRTRPIFTQIKALILSLISASVVRKFSIRILSFRLRVLCKANKK